MRLSEKLRRLKSGPSEKQGRLTRRGWMRKWDLFGKLVRVKRPSEKKKEDIYHYQRILAYRAPSGANKVTEYIKHWLCTICHVNDLPVWTSLLKFFHILAKLIRKTYVGSRGTETELQQTLPNFSRSTLACNSSIEYGAKHSGGTETALYLWKMSEQFQAKEAEWNNVKFEIQNWNQDGEIENPNISFPLCVKSLIRMGYGFLISNWNTALKIWFWRFIHKSNTYIVSVFKTSLKLFFKKRISFHNHHQYWSSRNQNDPFSPVQREEKGEDNKKFQSKICLALLCFLATFFFQLAMYFGTS